MQGCNRSERHGLGAMDVTEMVWGRSGAAGGSLQHRFWFVHCMLCMRCNLLRLGQMNHRPIAEELFVNGRESHSTRYVTDGGC